MEYNLTIIKNEILSFTKTWVNLEGIMLSEINQTQKDIYHMISSYRWNISKINEKKKNRNVGMDTENKQVVAIREKSQEMSEINEGN